MRDLIRDQKVNDIVWFALELEVLVMLLTPLWRNGGLLYTLRAKSTSLPELLYPLIPVSCPFRVPSLLIGSVEVVAEPLRIPRLNDASSPNG